MSMQSLTLLRSLYFHCPCNLSPFSVPYTSIVHAISHLSPFLILPLYTLSMKYLTLLRSLIIVPLYTLTMQSFILLRFLYFHCNVYPVQSPCNLSSFSVSYTSIVIPCPMSMQSLILLRSLYFHCIPCPCNLSSAVEYPFLPILLKTLPNSRLL